MLTATVADVANLDPRVCVDMHRLLLRYFDAAPRDRFDDDLAAKDTVILLHDAEGALCGFSTLSVAEMQIDGRAIRVVFSGDTIIDRTNWGSQAFAFAWLRQIGRIAAQSPRQPLYWLLIVKGHRTYRYLPTFGLDFVPDWRKPERRKLDELKDAIAARKFGHAYIPALGVVVFPDSRGHLAQPWASVSDREALRPEVRFFLERNPGYVKGDELVCLCELAEANMRPLTRRLFRQGFANEGLGANH